MQHIETITLSTSQSSITFSAIPQDFTDLNLVFSLRTNRQDDLVDVININLNGLSTNFSSAGLVGTGTNVSSDTQTTRLLLDQADGTTANTFGNTQVYISNYTASQSKSISVDGVSENNGSSAFQTIRAMLWNDTSAITSLNLAPGVGTAFLTGSTFSLYGITAGSDGTTTVS